MSLSKGLVFVFVISVLDPATACSLNDDVDGEEHESMDDKRNEMQTDTLVETPHVFSSVRGETSKEVTSHLVNKLVVSNRQTSVSETERREDEEDEL